MWWLLIGSAVENAALQHATYTDEMVRAMLLDKPVCQPIEVDFRDLFLSQEKDDEEGAGLGDMLQSMRDQWSGDFKAADVAQLLNYQGDYQIAQEKERAAAIREFLFPKMNANQDVSAIKVGKVLKERIGEPVLHGGVTLILRTGWDTHTKTSTFRVEEKAGSVAGSAGSAGSAGND